MFVLRMIGRLVVRATAVLLFMLIRGRKIIAAGLAVLVLGWILFANIGRVPFLAGVIPTLGTSSPPGGAVRPAASAKPGSGLTAQAEPAVDSYIKGLTEFDARLMWGALAEEAISAMRQRGGSLEALQSGLDDAKRRGAKYEDITMIGTYPLQAGGKYLFYVLSRRGFSGNESLEQVYFVFTVNRDGKITRIE